VPGEELLRLALPITAPDVDPEERQALSSSTVMTLALADCDGRTPRGGVTRHESSRKAGTSQYPLGPRPRPARAHEHGRTNGTAHAPDVRPVDEINRVRGCLPGTAERGAPRSAPNSWAQEIAPSGVPAARHLSR
jgi:hypothetical protein